MNWTEEQIDALVEHDRRSGDEPPRKSRARGVAPASDRVYCGRIYHSKSECEYAKLLDFRIIAGEIEAWMPQMPIILRVNGHEICKIVVDFEVTYPDGSKDLVEIKGHETELWRLKRKLLAACAPDRKYTVVKV